MNTAKAFGRILGQLREDNDLTQEKLCDELETKGNRLFNKSTISRWENGSRKPNIEIIKDLEEILGTEQGKLLRAAGYLIETSSAQPVSIQIDPISVKRKDEHFNHLAAIVSSMIPDKTTIIETIGSEYVIKISDGKQIKVTKEQLANSVKVFLEDAAKRYGHTDVYEYLLPHLEAEIAETEGKELNTFIKENPLKFYETLRFLADKRIFKGECPICRVL